MTERFVSRGFKGRARETDKAIKDRIPPGQFVTDTFPVLSAGPTPRTPLEKWNFSVFGEIDEDLKWTWSEFLKLPQESFTVDIHCVTKWSKLDTVWTGVSVDTLLEGVDLDRQSDVLHLIAYCDGGYDKPAARHPLVRFRRTGERISFDPWANARQLGELQGVFGIDGCPGGPTLD